MTFKELEEIAKGKALPLLGRNQDGEAFILEGGSYIDGKCFKLTTAQNNGWCRIHLYHEDGRVEEMYER